MLTERSARSHEGGGAGMEVFSRPSITHERGAERGGGGGCKWKFFPAGQRTMLLLLLFFSSQNYNHSVFLVNLQLEKCVCQTYPWHTLFKICVCHGIHGIHGGAAYDDSVLFVPTQLNVYSRLVTINVQCLALGLYEDSGRDTIGWLVILSV